VVSSWRNNDDASGSSFRSGWDRSRPIDGQASAPNARQVPPWPLEGSHHPGDLGLTRLHELCGHSDALHLLAHRRAAQRDALMTPAARAFSATSPAPGELVTQPGDQSLGVLPDGQHFPIKPVSLLRSLMLVGPVRSGKTTLLTWIAFLLHALGIPLILFDQKRSLYGQLAGVLGVDHVARLVMDQLPLNLVEPYGQTPYKGSVNDTVDLFGSASRRQRANESLHEVIDALMPGMPAGEYPDLAMIIAEAEQLLFRSKGRDRDLVLGLLQSLKQMQYAAPDVFKYRRTNTLDVLLSPQARAIVIEDPGLPAWIYLLIVGLILRRAYSHRKAIGSENVSGPVVLACDDATDLVDKAYDVASVGNASPIPATLKVCPEYQIGFWSAVHNLGSISDKLITHCKSFIFSGVDGRDLLIIGQMLGLNREQLDAMRQLRQDEYIAYLPDSYPRPVYLRITPPWLPPIL